MSDPLYQAICMHNKSITAKLPLSDCLVCTYSRGWDAAMALTEACNGVAKLESGPARSDASVINQYDVINSDNLGTLISLVNRRLRHDWVTVGSVNASWTGTRLEYTQTMTSHVKREVD